MKVRNLTFAFTSETKTTHSVTFTWKQPSFEYSKPLYYNVLVEFGATPYRYHPVRTLNDPCVKDKLHI